MPENKIDSAVIGKYCIVRGDRFGVLAGTVEAVDGDRVLLKDARKLHYWDGAAAVQQLALDGTTAPQNCRFTVTVESILLTGSCLAGRNAFVKDRGLTLDGETTVTDFIELTKSAYNGSVIRNLAKAYEKVVD